MFHFGKAKTTDQAALEVVMESHPMSEKIVNVQNIRKLFDNGKYIAVKDVSFHVRKGEIVGLLGANGAGKTTTLHMMLGITKPTSGRIELFGQSMEKARSHILQRINFASSYISLPYNLKVQDNLKIFARIYGVKSPDTRISELLDMFEISHLRKKTSGMLSSGEQTRLNLCKALLNRPELLILDEPTASLDPDLADKVRKVLKYVSTEDNTTIITSSHNMLDVAELCDRVIFMSSGLVVTEGSSDEILRTYGSDSLEEVFITIARQNLLEKAKAS